MIFIDSEKITQVQTELVTTLKTLEGVSLTIEWSFRKFVARVLTKFRIEDLDFGDFA